MYVYNLMFRMDGKKTHTHTQCNGGLPPDIILLTLYDYCTLGNPFNTMYLVEFLSLQPMFPPKPFD